LMRQAHLARWQSGAAKGATIHRVKADGDIVAAGVRKIERVSSNSNIPRAGHGQPSATMTADAAALKDRATRRLGELMDAQRRTVGLAKGAAEKRGLSENPRINGVPVSRNPPVPTVLFTTRPSPAIVEARTSELGSMIPVNVGRGDEGSRPKNDASVVTPIRGSGSISENRTGNRRTTSSASIAGILTTVESTASFTASRPSWLSPL
jgi:hypothetical protein